MAGDGGRLNVVMLGPSTKVSVHIRPYISVGAGKVGGLRSHRWLVMAADSKVVIQDLVSGRAREALRTLWGGKDPTALAFLYANAARLLGFDAGTNANEVVLGPLLAVGTTAGTTTLLNFVTLQVRH